VPKRPQRVGAGIRPLPLTPQSKAKPARRTHHSRWPCLPHTQLRQSRNRDCPRMEEALRATSARRTRQRSRLPRVPGMRPRRPLNRPPGTIPRTQTMTAAASPPERRRRPNSSQDRRKKSHQTADQQEVGVDL
jgi:hypothetical protein